MRLLIDMNLSPAWVEVFVRQGWQAQHWSMIGDPTAADSIVMHWASSHGYLVFTNDLDFGALLALGQAEGPSVFQVRARDVTPEHLAEIVVDALKEYEALLETGALVILDESNLRARILPLRRS